MTIAYDGSAAALLEAMYLGPDVVAQRLDTLRKLDIRPGEKVLDIGSGPGFLAEAIADQTGPSGAVTGVDISGEMIGRARSRNTRAWLDYQQADATALPFKDASFDVVVSTQVAEYVPDIATFCSEVFRVMMPGGRGLILATDWDALIWHSDHRDRMTKVLQAFAPHCAHSSLPRSLAARLRAAGLIVQDISYFPILNVDRYDGCYSQMLVPLIINYVQARATMAAHDLQAWAYEQTALNAHGEHFFSTGRFSFGLVKPG